MGRQSTPTPQLGRSFKRVMKPRYGRLFSEQARRSRLLDHPMSLNERINNVPAGHTSPSFHPHRNTALLHVDQVIDNHETVTSDALHGTLLCRDGIPSTPTLERSSLKTLQAVQRLMLYKANVMPQHKSAG
jgi:hypothetical protein